MLKLSCECHLSHSEPCGYLLSLSSSENLMLPDIKLSLLSCRSMAPPLAVLSLLLLLRISTPVQAQEPRTEGPPVDYWHPVESDGIRLATRFMSNNFSQSDESAGRERGRLLEGRRLADKNATGSSNGTTPVPARACDFSDLSGNICVSTDEYNTYCCDAGFKVRCHSFKEKESVFVH
jgi:hypothetical protein